MTSRRSAPTPRSARPRRPRPRLLEHRAARLRAVASRRPLVPREVDSFAAAASIDSGCCGRPPAHLGEERAVEDERAGPRRVREELAERPAPRVARASRPASDERAPASGVSAGGDGEQETMRQRQHEERQPPVDSATTPITGMPTIHAVGGLASAWATTRVRRSGSLQAAVAATPAASRIAIPAHIGTCASASSTNEGAAALASDPAASSAPRPRGARAARAARASVPRPRRRLRRAARRGCELTGLRDRDAELVGDVREDRRQHEHAGLAREEREEEHRGWGRALTVRWPAM